MKTWFEIMNILDEFEKTARARILKTSRTGFTNTLFQARATWTSRKFSMHFDISYEGFVTIDLFDIPNPERPQLFQ